MDCALCAPHSPATLRAMIPPSLPPPLPSSLECYCTVCGTEGATKQVMFFQHIGAVVLMFNRHIKGRLCRNCINEYFATYTVMTTFLGWWGMISFFLTPLVLLHNFIRYLFCLGLKPAPHTPASGTVPAFLVLFLAGGALTVLAGLVVMVLRG